MDVVPANPENWERDPFSLSVEGDRLYGRGEAASEGEEVWLSGRSKHELASSSVVLQPPARILGPYTPPLALCKPLV
jgi:acetylornithine deacetylase